MINNDNTLNMLTRNALATNIVIRKLEVFIIRARTPFFLKKIRFHSCYFQQKIELLLLEREEQIKRYSEDAKDKKKPVRV